MVQPYGGVAVSLERATKSVRALNATLAHCSQNLEAETSDLPRVARVTDNRKCYELVAESEVRSAQFQLTSEIEPQISELLRGAERSLARLETREAALRETSAPSLPHPELESLHAECLREKGSLESELLALDAELRRKRTVLQGLSST